MKFAEWFGEFKTWIAIVTVIAGVVVGVVTYMNLPKKVDALDRKVEVAHKRIGDTQDNVQKVAASVDSFVAEQRVIQREQEKREGLMIELIKSVKESK